MTLVDTCACPSSAHCQLHIHFETCGFCLHASVTGTALPCETRDRLLATAGQCRAYTWTGWREAFDRRQPPAPRAEEEDCSAPVLTVRPVTAWITLLLAIGCWGAVAGLLVWVFW